MKLLLKFEFHEKCKAHEALGHKITEACLNVTDTYFIVRKIIKRCCSKFEFHTWPCNYGDIIVLFLGFSSLMDITCT